MDQQKRKYIYIVFSSIIAVGLSYVLSRTNYLLYHILIEFFSVFTCLLIFFISIFSKKYSGAGIIEIIGAGYLYVAVLDFIHALAFRGMNVLINVNDDLATQIWIIARFTQALILLSGVILINKKPKYRSVFVFYTIVAVTLGILPFINLFPTCFIEDIGLTPFKVAAEYFIVIMLMTTIFLIRRSREQIEKALRQKLCISVSLAILAELAFTLYMDTTGLISTIGHVFKLFSTLVLLSMILDYGLRDTYQNVFKKLNTEKEFLKTILQSISDAVIATNKEGEIISLNHAAELLLKTEYKDIAGRKFDEAVYIYDRNTRVRIENVLEVLKQVNKNQSDTTRFMISVSNDDRIINIRASVILENPMIETVVVISDISSFVNLEVSMINQQRLQSVGVLASSVAHEINNPIMGIMNYSQLILDQKIDNISINNYATEIIAESNRISEIVRNLLSFSKQKTNEWNDYDINEIVEDSIMLMNSFILKDNIELDVRTDNTLPKVYCNKQEILQVIINLVANSKDAVNEKYQNKPGVKKISIKCEKTGRDNQEFIKCTIRDNGAGLSENAKDHIFVPFFTTKTSELGTGLGVPISHEIIKRHKGYLEYKSEENEYTEASFLLPVKKMEIV
ncbi:MAG: PAS domain-containing protein [Clostridia bacterium]|nr:PAS domain-containing protein [Clostridia bacterium]